MRSCGSICILEKEFGVRYKLSGVYDLIHQLNLSVLVPRLQHRQSDAQAMKDWTQRAPFFVRQVQRQHPDKRVAVWFQDEARPRKSASKAR